MNRPPSQFYYGAFASEWRWERIGELAEEKEQGCLYGYQTMPIRLCSFCARQEAK
jgi:hypothetical protein